MALWGGRFEGESNPLFRALNDSLPFDWRLAQQDIAGSIAWAGALERAGVLTREEAQQVRAGLEQVAAEAAGLAAPPVESGAEDVHSWVEARLIDRIGPLGKKLHTGRSRNDQVATDLRLWTREAIDERITEIRAAQVAIISLAQRADSAVLPGYTHLQRAQPVLFDHWCLAYVEMLERDAARFADARGRANICPLGCGALAGAAWPIDREALARELGFDSASLNSLDAVSDRDFALETLSAAAACAIHLSRLAEDLIIYTSGEFAFLELGDSVTSGSSLMPQKKNPDALELLRGKVGRILGAHTSLATTLKGLPLAYNKDLQEDKEPLFDAMDHLSLCLQVVPRVCDGVTLHPERMLAAARGGHANATDLADYLVERGVPFREAHDIVGRLVRLALERGAALEDLPLADLQGACDRIGPDVFDRLTIEAGMARRDALGGTSPRRVREALAAAKRRLESHAKAETGGAARRGRPA